MTQMFDPPGQHEQWNGQPTCTSMPPPASATQGPLSRFSVAGCKEYRR